MAADLQISISEAQLIGLFLETLLYGIYLVTLGYTLRVLLFDSSASPSSSSSSFSSYFKKPGKINWTMLVTALLMCTFATLDVSLGLAHNIHAFIFFNGGSSDEAFTDISDWVNVVKTVDVVIQTLIGDAILIYRCWVVYSRQWLIVVLPILLWIGDAICTIWIIYLETALHSKVLITASQLQPLVTSFWVLTIALNLLATTLIVLRIWQVDQNSARWAISSGSTRTSGSRLSRLQRVMRIIIESGLMYTSIAVITFITYITNNNSNYATSDAEVMIIGIAFNLIIIRTDSRPSDEYTMRPSASQGGGNSNTLPLSFVSRSKMSAANTTTTFGEGVRVMVTQTEEADADDKDSGSMRSNHMHHPYGESGMKHGSEF